VVATKIGLRLSRSHVARSRNRGAIASYEKTRFILVSLCASLRTIALMPPFSDSDDGAVLGQQAAMLERAGRINEAIDAWARACSARPRRADWAHRAGSLLLRASRPREAVTMLRRVIALEPKNTRAMQDLGIALFRDSQFGESARCYDRLSALDPLKPGHLVHLAAALDRHRDARGARTAIARALELDPNCGPALVILAEHQLREGDARAAIATAERSIAHSTERRAQARAHHLMGKALDRLGDHAGAFAAHMRGNAVTLEILDGPAVLRSPIEWRMRALRRDGLADRFAAWARAAPTGTPDPVFLFGFPRSGTTLMEQVLGALPCLATNDEQAHSGVVLQAIEKDYPGSLGRDLTATLDGLTPEELERYRLVFWEEIVRRIPGWREDRGMIAVDKQPLRIMDIALIQRLFPRARMVVMVRDPRDVCLSALFQDFDPNPFMARFLDLDATADFHTEVMSFWLEMRGILTMPWVEVQYRHLVRAFDAETRRVAEFLGVPWSDDVVRFDEAAQRRAVSSASFESVTGKLNASSIGRWRAYRDHLEPILDRLQPIVEAFGFDPHNTDAHE
jgi:Flp pilus assembly protein TadD